MKINMIIKKMLTLFFVLIILLSCSVPPLIVTIAEEGLNSPTDLKVENHNGSVTAYFYGLNYEEFFAGYQLYRSGQLNADILGKSEVSHTNLTRALANPNTLYSLNSTGVNGTILYYSVYAFDTDGDHSESSQEQIGVPRYETNDVTLINSNVGTNADGMVIDLNSGKITITNYPGSGEIYFTLTSYKTSIFPEIYSKTGYLMDLGYYTNWYERNKAPENGYLSLGIPVVLAKNHLYVLKLSG